MTGGKRARSCGEGGDRWGGGDGELRGGGEGQRWREMGGGERAGVGARGAGGV